jgi:hypothetical protein
MKNLNDSTFSQTSYIINQTSDSSNLSYIQNKIYDLKKKVFNMEDLIVKYKSNLSEQTKDFRDKINFITESILNKKSRYDILTSTNKINE